MKSSKDAIPYLHVTSNLDDEPDKGMLRKKGGRGFPFVLFMDHEGEKLFEFRPSARKSTEIAMWDAAALVQARAAVAKKKNKKNERRLVLMENLRGLAEEPADFETLKKIAESRDLQRKVKGIEKRWAYYVKLRPFAEIKAEFDAAQQEAQQKRDRSLMEKAEARAGEKAMALYRDDQKLEDPEDGWVYFYYWNWIFSAAVEKKDKTVAKDAFAHLERFDDPGAQRYVSGRLKPQLDEL